MRLYFGTTVNEAELCHSEQNIQNTPVSRKTVYNVYCNRSSLSGGSCWSDAMWSEQGGADDVRSYSRELPFK